MKDKAQIELNLAKDIQDNKKGFYWWRKGHQGKCGPPPEGKNNNNKIK